MDPKEASLQKALNVLGKNLEQCSCQPLTGWYRDGFCKTDISDHGQHTVCCVLTDSFLTYSKAQGNDLSTPMPEFGFEGLKAGDKWCLCAPRWRQAFDDGMAPQVVLEATNIQCLNLIPLELLMQNSYSRPS